VDRALYESIASASRELIYSHTIAPISSHAWRVPARHILRLTTPEGPQVGDLNIWNFYNPRERLWASRTRQLQRAHVTTFDRLWSTLPYLRPLVTIVGDSLGDRGITRVHDLLGTRCDPYVNKLLTGLDYDYHCHSNLVRAVLPLGLTEFDVHDVINVFQVTGLDKEERYFMEPSPAVAGDYLDLFAEQDLLCALSTCPGGDLSTWGWAADGEAGGVVNSSDCCRSIGVEVYKIIDEKNVLKSWEGALDPGHGYSGLHGIHMKESRARIN
ncbi:hypothetical protein BDQ12DRAFT_763611, partial [Crucibulum laeve]